ncbi:integrase core domain-containing protein [Mycobacterium branderi]
MKRAPPLLPTLLPTPAPGPSKAGRSPPRCAPRICCCRHSITLYGKRIRTFRVGPSFRPRIALPIAGLHRAAGKLGIAPSFGSRGDGYDKALAEAGHRRLQERTDQLRQTLAQRRRRRTGHRTWVAWYTQERLHEALGYKTPAEYEAALTGASHLASQPTPALATD